MSVRFEPLLTRVLVEELPDASVSPGGIVIPDTAQGSQMKFRKCRVVAVGPGARDSDGGHIPLSVKEGDVIYVGRFLMEDIEIAGKKHGLIHENDIFGRLVDDDEAPSNHAFKSDRSGKRCITCRQDKASHLKKVG